jgi:type III secretory pathway component EscT
VARVIVTFVVVWLAVAAVGVLIQYLVTPTSPTVVSLLGLVIGGILLGLVIGAIAAFTVYRRRST